MPLACARMRAHIREIQKTVWHHPAKSWLSHMRFETSERMPLNFKASMLSVPRPGRLTATLVGSVGGLHQAWALQIAEESLSYVQAVLAFTVRRRSEVLCHERRHTADRYSGGKE